MAELYLSSSELSKLRDTIIDIITNEKITNSTELKNELVKKGFSSILKKHFSTNDGFKFDVVENYAKENTNIEEAKKSLMSVILLQEKWHEKKNKNLSKIT